LYPTHNLARDAAMRIAQTYQNNLKQPLRAAEAYQEVNVARGGRDTGIQNQIYQIGLRLRNDKRWVEALHVLEMFVDSFPRHPQAGQALTTIGQVHQTNEAWEEAIAAYRRVIDEFPTGDWVKEAKWSIAECTINLSQWRDAMAGYENYQRDYPRDGRGNEAKRRIGILKDLVRYQALVDEEGQRKAFDAQYQIAQIMLEKLSNRVKSIIEYRKVAANWPESHLADDALYAVGTTYVAMGEMDKAREALKTVGKLYPDSPLADDALFMVGKSYEDEANRLAGATRAQTLQRAQELAQKEAYYNVQQFREKQRDMRADRIASLKIAGKMKKAELEEAKAAVGERTEFSANVALQAGGARQIVEFLTAVQLADRQDKVNAALRKAVGAYKDASKVAGADKAGDALLKMATIFDERLKDPVAAMAAWLEIVRQFSGTSVAEDASWRIAQHYERQREYENAIEHYKAFLRNYRRSPKAGDAQFAIAENCEHLGQWVHAMDAYTNYINNFPSGPMVNKAREQINWIKAYRL
jgi:TolA-binding protein